MPLIDLDIAALRAGEGAARREAVAAIARAGVSGAALAARGHGVDAAVLARAFDAAREFFALPLAAKRRYAAGRDNLRGYQGLPEGPGDVREKFLLTSDLGPLGGGAPAAMAGDNRWPEELPGFREAAEDCRRALDGLGRAVLRGLSESLGLAPEALGASCDPPGGSCLWLLHYPAVTPVNGRPGQGTSAHTDLHPLAIIVQDERGGLEVHEGGAWEPVDPSAAPVVCQMGDTVGRWSNGLYRPNVHRVRSPAAASRYSLALFMQPAFAAVVAPAAGVGPDRPARHAPIAFGAYMDEWFRALDEGRSGYVPGV